MHSMYDGGDCRHYCEVRRSEVMQLAARVSELEKFTEYLVDYINTNLQKKLPEQTQPGENS